MRLLLVLILCLSLASAGDVYYYHNDHLGSPRVVVSGGEVVWSGDYSEFGGVAREEGVGDLMYNVKELDSSGLYYYGARFYSASLGRFVSADSVEVHPNPYVYVGNNPLVRIDPSGKKANPVGKINNRNLLEIDLDGKFGEILDDIERRVQDLMFMEGSMNTQYTYYAEVSKVMWNDYAYDKSRLGSDYDYYSVYHTGEVVVQDLLKPEVAEANERLADSKFPDDRRKSVDMINKLNRDARKSKKNMYQRNYYPTEIKKLGPMLCEGKTVCAEKAQGELFGARRVSEFLGDGSEIKLASFDGAEGEAHAAVVLIENPGTAQADTSVITWGNVYDLGSFKDAYYGEVEIHD